MLWDLPADPQKMPAIIDLARKATTLCPHGAQHWVSLARLLLRTGRNDDAVEILTEAIAEVPVEPKLHLMLADACHRAGKFDLFREILEQAPECPASDRETTLFRLELRMRTRSQDAALAATEALGLDPTNPEAIKIVGGLSRENGNVERMLPICQAALAIQPLHTLARYELAVALSVLGRADDARALIDLYRFVSLTDLAAPAEYSDTETFHSELIAEIRRNATLKPDPVGKATKSGMQTGGLPQEGDHAIATLLGALRSAVDAAESNLVEKFQDAFVERRPKKSRLRAWAVVVPGNGHQVAHIHPDGWLSGVYYVSAPEGAPDDHRAGCLVLGRLDLKGQNFDPPWGVRDIKPVPGRLVLFPSYIPHGTMPTNAQGDRICISFDVIAAGAETVFSA